MNSVRIKDQLQRAWLQVSKVNSPKEGHSTLRAVMFDGTPVEFSLPDHSYEVATKGRTALVEVGYVGNIGTSGIAEIILPAPSITQGHNIRVQEQTLYKWEVYSKLKGG